VYRFDAVEATTAAGIRAAVGALLGGRYADLLPADRGSRVLLKPNLNSYMNALTGNTTDLRVLAAVLGFLKDAGYRRVTVGEGTNSGFYRCRISVIERLRVDRLARHFGAEVKDLNYAEPFPIEFEDGVSAAVARDCVEAELFINLPKLKTHFENGMSVCAKNLMGCLVGQENKKKTHRSLAANILNINRQVRPHLHLVDAVVSMEGLGPTRGTPVKTGMLFAGTDPLLVDLVCARFASFDSERVRTLAEAGRRGLIDESRRAFAAAVALPRTFRFAPPTAGPIATFIHSPKRQRYFLAVRNTPLFNHLCSTRAVGALLYKTGLRQDVFLDEELTFRSLTVDAGRCTSCGKCADYCPVGLELPAALAGGAADRCVQCLYCHAVCPERAILFDGEPGFYAEQMKQYDGIIRRMA
jgi:uncharacterized protein (DUF362 family)/Pyruvate/2-oxoacid:ferredoxin oxidoreductase delta subunit